MRQSRLCVYLNGIHKVLVVVGSLFLAAFLILVYKPPTLQLMNATVTSVFQSSLNSDDKNLPNYTKSLKTKKRFCFLCSSRFLFLSFYFLVLTKLQHKYSYYITYYLFTNTILKWWFTQTAIVPCSVESHVSFHLSALTKRKQWLLSLWSADCCSDLEAVSADVCTCFI